MPRVSHLGTRFVSQFGLLDEDGDVTEVKNAEGMIKKLREKEMLELLDELQAVRLKLEQGLPVTEEPPSGGPQRA